MGANELLPQSKKDEENICRGINNIKNYLDISRSNFEFMYVIGRGGFGKVNR